MELPVNNSWHTGVSRPTAFRRGVSGNPTGRPRGALNKSTLEARQLATSLIDDPLYLDALRRRLIAGTAGQIEVLLWHHAHGKPVDRVETGAPGAFAALTNDELKAKLMSTLAEL